MKDGLVKVALAVPRVAVANPKKNADEIIKLIKAAGVAGAKVVVFPELSLVSATAGDLMFSNELLKDAENALLKIAEETADLDILAFVGTIVRRHSRVYDATAAVLSGNIEAVIPRVNPKDLGLSERFLEKNAPSDDYITIGDTETSFGTDIIFSVTDMPDFTIGCVTGYDYSSLALLETRLALLGANVIVNPGALSASYGYENNVRTDIKALSKRLNIAYITVNPGPTESTVDKVFTGYGAICECGEILKETDPFEDGMLATDIDIEAITYLRSKNPSMSPEDPEDGSFTEIEIPIKKTKLTREYSKYPFISADKVSQAHDILNIQTYGLMKRMSHVNSGHPVIGISGGLDSTLALIVSALTVDKMGLSRDSIIAVTMPCFGTTNRTYKNACELCRLMGASLTEISIKKAVTQHFKDIGQDSEKHDAAYENSQARERTQVLMDMANRVNGLVVGTGDLSELALGWATYNGDHMSMYAVNAGITKTLMRSVIGVYADECNNEELRKVLLDVLDTPVSPELLPASKGTIAQKTEDLVGPYELHDFFLYYFLKYGFTKKKISRIAKVAFKKDFSDDTIDKWLNVFFKRFASQQFKRSCLPDGPKVTDISLSPRGGFMMPSDSEF